MLEKLFVMIIGYSFGCIQSAYAVGKIVGGIDIRNHGTSNAGASNVTTVLGWRYGLTVAIIDILKGFLAVQMVNLLYPGDVSLKVLAGSTVILGHVFPVFLGFRGGKGCASFVGALLAINPIFGLVNIAIVTVITLATNYIALGTITMYIMMFIVGLFFNLSVDTIIMTFLLLIVILYKHKINISRIISGTEIGFRDNLNKNKAK